jgi:hypothetical protein
LDAPTSQALPQGIAVVAPIRHHALGLLPGTTRLMPSAYADRPQCRFRERDFVRGRCVKLVSQRKTLAVDHQHPLRAFPPAGFADRGAPFLAGAKLPSRNDSLHFSSSRPFSSPKNARQMFSQIPCCSQARSCRQQVDGCGNSSGRSCQRAPLRRIQRMPSSTLRSGARGRPPWRCRGGLSSEGRIPAKVEGSTRRYVTQQNRSKTLSDAM